MKITTAIRVHVEDDDEEQRERVLDLAQEEVLRFSAALANRLEEEGIEGVEIAIEGDE